MKSSIKSALALCLFSLVLAGCTHIETVPLSPNFEAEISDTNALSEIDMKTSFARGDYQDKRGDTSKLASFKQQVHTFHLTEGRPIQDVIYEGLTSLVNKSGHTYSEQSDARVLMNVNLLSVEAARNAGMVSVSADSRVQIKIDFVDTRSGEVFYSEVYNGQDNRENAMIGLMGMVFDSIDSSIINCIESVGKDDKLAKKLATL